jgi:hypothetical protein
MSWCEHSDSTVIAQYYLHILVRLLFCLWVVHSVRPGVPTVEVVLIQSQ